MDEDGALALPAKAGGRGDGLLEYGARVDVRLLLTAQYLHRFAKLLQAGEKHVVVIGTERVFRDTVTGRRMRLIIIKPDDHEAAGLRHHLAGVGASFGITGQPGHVAVHAVGDPLLKIIGADVDLDWRHAERVKAQRLRRSLESLAEGARVHRTQPRIESTRLTISSTGASLPLPS